MKKNILLATAGLLTFGCSFSVNGQKQAIEKSIERKEAISHFRYLAADELKGRDAMRPEIDIAARYIAEQFWKYGARELPDAKDYYQPIPFHVSSPPTYGEIKMGDSTLLHGEDMLVLDGPEFTGNYPMVVAGHGLEKDLKGIDLTGKILVVRVGAPDRMSPSQLFAAGREKLALAQAKGAVGVIELYNLPTTPWSLLVNFLNKPQLTTNQNTSEEAGTIPYLWVKDLSNELIAAIDKGDIEQAEVNIEGKMNRKLTGKNVVGYIEGTDPKMKNEYVMLSAHYDHIGVGSPDADGDSIYNGARDNAVGTVAIINAAKYFAENPPKRSILLCAWTAEEKGLLGSAYFAENPLVPLDQIIYNLNIDNAGYNDTSIITVIGLGRTSADGMVEKAVAEFGIKAVADPSPEQGLYDRSDNVNFARKGIPAPTFSLGFTAFDDEINKYYHQAADQVDNFDLDYAMLYWKSYLLSASYIANADNQPQWVSGDKYEEVGNQLYGIE
ncbi:MAG: M28 family peptidase [Anditalea sp.]